MSLSSKAKENMPGIIACTAIFIFWSIQLIIKYIHFGFNDWDLALFSQAMWNLSHGSAFASVFEVNIFSNHANLIALLLVPIFKVFPSPMTLLVLKAMSFAAACYFLYLFLKEKLPGPWCIFILALYIIYPANIYGLTYEFDFESLAPGLLMGAFYFLHKDRYGLFLVFSVLLILTKENLPLVVLAMGIYGLFSKKDKVRWGIVPIVLSVVSFCLIMFVFMPSVSGRSVGEAHPYYMTSNYKQLGGSLPAILTSIVFRPLDVLHIVFSDLNLDWLSELFSPLFFLSFISPAVLFIISPLMAQHMLSSSINEHHIFFAYVLPIAPFIFLGFGFAIKRLLGISRLLAFGALGLAIMLSLVNFFYHGPRMAARYLYQVDQKLNEDRWSIIKEVPDNASIIASFPLLSALSMREELYPFHKVYSSKYQKGPYPYQAPAQVQYALIDFKDPYFLEAMDHYPDDALGRMRKFLGEGNWALVSSRNQLYLFKKGRL